MHGSSRRLKGFPYNTPMTRAFIGIGTNVGDRHAHIEHARQSLAALPDTRLIKFSSIYETAPVGPIQQGDFLNAAAEIETTLEPAELLAELKKIEQSAGRTPEATRLKWGPRTLDLDILLYGNRIIDTGPPVVPHPHMHERLFVLEPLAELDPDAMHPKLKQTVAQLLAKLQRD